ncbi:hypothetical protein NDK47_21400 [Brevibacillus ruminantium]|uniref:MFS transporter n=1 Tax=Brevibacillus ruminantium TaxID=2950604 RepID=A0ABY4WEW7_9BACL|nr:hypothetical protein [Brevibacillus ruminantium]USG64673.1 hypothetical protein NDK47_21400 [Brevibacillus ruminantium]
MILSGLSGYYVVYLSLTLLFSLLLFRRTPSRKRLIAIAGLGTAILLGALLPFSLLFLGRLETAVIFILITLALSYFLAGRLERTAFSEEAAAMADPLSTNLPVQSHESVIPADTPTLSTYSPETVPAEGPHAWEPGQQQAVLDEIAAALQPESAAGVEHAVEPDEREPASELTAFVDDDLLEWTLKDDSSTDDACAEQVEVLAEQVNLFTDRAEPFISNWPQENGASEDKLLSSFEEELDRVDDPFLREDSTYLKRPTGNQSELATTNRK